VNRIGRPTIVSMPVALPKLYLVVVNQAFGDGRARWKLGVLCLLLRFIPRLAHRGLDDGLHLLDLIIFGPCILFGCSDATR
jgi:hypothetical protein